MIDNTCCIFNARFLYRLRVRTRSIALPSTARYYRQRPLRTVNGRSEKTTFVLHCNYVCLLHRLRDIIGYNLKFKRDHVTL